MVKKKNPISVTGQGGHHVKVHGKTNQVRAFFGPGSLRPKEREYEEGLGRRFRDLERGLASRPLEWRPNTAAPAKDEDKIGGARKARGGALGHRRDGVEEDRRSPKVSYEKGLGSKFRALQMSLSQQEEADRRDGVEENRPSSEVSYEKGLGSQFRALQMSLSQDSMGMGLTRTEGVEKDGGAKEAADMVLTTAARAEEPPRSPTSIFDMEQRDESDNKVIASEEEGATKSKRKEEQAALPAIPSILDDASSMEDSSEDNCFVSSVSGDIWDNLDKEPKTEQEDVHVGMESKTNIEPGMEVTEFYGQIDEFCDQIVCFGGNFKL